MLYSFFAQSLSAPRDELAGALCDGALRATVEEALRGAPAAHRRGHDWSAVAEIGGPEGLEAVRTALEADYTRLFGVAVACPHYEADYVSGDPFRAVHVISDVTTFYSTFGVKTASGAGERPDYIAIELEFMNFLCAKQAHALAQAQPARARLCKDAQARFMKDHLGRWAGAFAERLVEASGGGFYGVVGRLLRSFAAAESAYLDASPEGTDPVIPKLNIVG